MAAIDCELNPDITFISVLIKARTGPRYNVMVIFTRTMLPYTVMS